MANNRGEIIVDFYDSDNPCYLRVRIKESDLERLKAINTKLHRYGDFSVDDLLNEIVGSGMKHEVLPSEGDVFLYF